MKFSVSVEGLKDLDAALQDLSKGVARGALRRALIRAATPVRDTMKAYAPGLAAGGLKESIEIGNRLEPRQARMHRKAVDARSGIELFVGPSYKLGRGGRTAHLFEFGTRERVRKNGGRTGKIRMQPFARPAWDAEQGNALSILKTALWQEVSQATERAQRKAARLALKG
jgi:hypothetical protein